VIQPVWKVLGQGLRTVVNPKLSRTEQTVTRWLEEIVESGSETGRPKSISKLFQELKIENYSIYLRARHGVFALGVDSSKADAPPHLKPSAYLRENLLAGRRTFVDFENVSREWRYYWHQFELGRIEQETGCRYLLPICIGKSVRGLLMLGTGTDELCRDDFAEQFDAIAVSAVSTGTENSVAAETQTRAGALQAAIPTREEAVPPLNVRVKNS
jgi:hypothetical protein